jgi:hypothetical protein
MKQMMSSRFKTAVSCIGPDATQVTLIGPPLGISPTWSWQHFEDWQDTLVRDWLKHCEEVKPFGLWATSSNIDDNTQYYHLHFWFAHASDAVIFKLKFNHYTETGG